MLSGYTLIRYIKNMVLADLIDLAGFESFSYLGIRIHVFKYNAFGTVCECFLRLNEFSPTDSNTQNSNFFQCGLCVTSFNTSMDINIILFINSKNSFIRATGNNF